MTFLCNCLVKLAQSGNDESNMSVGTDSQGLSTLNFNYIYFKVLFPTSLRLCGTYITTRSLHLSQHYSMGGSSEFSFFLSRSCNKTITVLLHYFLFELAVAVFLYFEQSLFFL